MSGRRRWSEEAGRLGRGGLAILVPWRESPTSAAALESVQRHTPAEVSVLVLHEDASRPELPDGGGVIAERVDAIDGALLAYAAQAGAADVLVVDGVRVGPGYLDGLRAAAQSDTTIATASAWCAPAPDAVPGQEWADRQARVVSQSALSVVPRVSALDRRCVLLRRAALDVLERGSASPVSLSEASDLLLAAGLVHVVADDVWVAAPAGTHPPPAVERDLTDERGTLARAVTLGRASRDGLSVTIDARALTSAVGGTQSYLVGLIRALSGADGLSLRAVVAPRDLSDRGRAVLEECRVEIVTYEQAVAGIEPTDLVHRPQQVFVEGDLNLLRLLGRRIVIDHLDLIGYRNPAYHSDDAAWRAYRRITRLALASADRVLFFSEHARDDAVREDLIGAERCVIAGIGGEDEAGEGMGVTVAAPDGVDPQRPMLVCLGSDYGHKNRPFAIALLDALRRRHGWDGDLVLAGPHVEHGSTREQERELRARLPDLHARVRDLGPVDEAGRAWLYAHASAIVYPSTYEGYGLVPFEAARTGTPCLFAAQASLAELAGEEATLVPWNAEASADAVIALLGPGEQREAHVAALRRRAEATTWSDVVQRIQGAYWEAMRSPQRAASVRVGQELERESYIAHLGEDVEHLKRVAQEYQDALHDLERRVTVGLPLIDEGGLLTPAEQRGLMRIAARRGLHRALLGPVGLLGRRAGRS